VDPAEVDNLKEFLDETGFSAVYQQYENDLSSIEELMQADKSRELIDRRDKLKRDFARKVREGI